MIVSPYKTSCLILTYFLFLVSCNQKIKPTANKDSTKKDTALVTTIKVDTTETLEPQEENLEVENPTLSYYKKYLQDEWKNTPNPLIAKYTGNSIGDYFHFIFEDASGKAYDFGDGDNNLSGLPFFDDDYIDNPEYLNKKFKIDWEWKVSKFPCCEGEYTVVEMEVPSIIKIELLKN